MIGYMTWYAQAFAGDYPNWILTITTVFADSEQSGKYSSVIADCLFNRRTLFQFQVTSDLEEPILHASKSCARDPFTKFRQEEWDCE